MMNFSNRLGKEPVLIIGMFQTVDRDVWTFAHTDFLNEVVYKLNDVLVTIRGLMGSDYEYFGNIAFYSQEEYLKFRLMTSDFILPANDSIYYPNTPAWETFISRLSSEHDFNYYVL